MSLRILILTLLACLQYLAASYAQTCDTQTFEILNNGINTESDALGGVSGFLQINEDAISFLGAQTIDSCTYNVIGSIVIFGASFNATFTQCTAEPASSCTCDGVIDLNTVNAGEVTFSDTSSTSKCDTGVIRLLNLDLNWTARSASSRLVASLSLIFAVFLYIMM